MARWLYFDCYSGAAGDMLLGALVDAGLPVADLEQALGGLPVSGYRLWPERVTRQGVTGTRMHVDVDASGQPHRHLADVLALLAASSLPESVIARTGAVFRRLAEAEAAVHGTTLEGVHFHEVGAIDSIVDVTGTMWGLHALGIERVFCSALPLGDGWVNTAHGRLPVPAPATLRLLASAGAPSRPLPQLAQAELVTPTAAAILAELATWGQPRLRLERVGYGFGLRELPWPNAVRVWLGQADIEVEKAPLYQGFEGYGEFEEAMASHEPLRAVGVNDGADLEVESDKAVLIECNLDNTTGEALGYAMERLMSAGALDVWFTSIQMKKNRPGVLLSVLSTPERAGDLALLVLRETTTLGVRRRVVERLKAGRESIALVTAWGSVRAKVKRLAGRPVLAQPEYEDCAALARESGVPLLDVYAAAQVAAFAALASLDAGSTGEASGASAANAG